MEIEISKITPNNPDGGENRETFISPDLNGQKWRREEMIRAFRDLNNWDGAILVENLKSHKTWRA